MPIHHRVFRAVPVATHGHRGRGGGGRGLSVAVGEPGTASWTVAHPPPVRWEPDTLIHVSDPTGTI